MLNRLSSFAVIMSVMVLLSTALFAAENIPSHEAIATIVDGTAEILAKGADPAHALRKGDGIRKDQTVKVGDKSRVEIRFPDGTVMRLSERSRLAMQDIMYDNTTEGKNVKVNLTIGKLWANVRKLVTPDSKVEVRTGNAVAGVRGTTYRVSVDGDKSALVKVYDGTVYVANPPKDAATGRPAVQVSKPAEVSGPYAVAPAFHEVSMEEWTVIVKAMQQVTVSPQGIASKPQDFDARSDADAWVTWNQERDKQAL